MPVFDDPDDDLFDSPAPRKPKPSNKVVFQPAGAKWSLDRLSEVENLYQTSFKKRLPLVNRGQGSIHRKWGYDHRDSADVSIDPSTPEGQQFGEKLKAMNIPFLAFKSAIPGVATGPHYHIGFPSKRTTQKFNVGAQKKGQRVASDDLFDAPQKQVDDDLFDPVSEQTPPPTSLQPAKAKSIPPRATSAPKKDAVQALQELMESTNRATARLQRQAIPQLDKSVPSMMDIARQAINSPEGRMKDQIREQVRRERPTGIRTPWNEGQPSQVGADLENEEVEKRFQAAQRANTPEMTQARKEYGREGAPVRAITQPIGRFAAGALKTFGGITSAFGIAPNKVSDWANERGQFVEESTINAPLDEAGEEIKRGIPEKVAQGVADLGITIGQLIALKRATRLPMNQLMALESGLKTSDLPTTERVKAATEAYALGTVLDQHLGRAASAALFGGPTALQTGAEVIAGRMSPEDALIQTGIQTGAGAALGAKKPSAFKRAFERERPRQTAPPDAEIAARLRKQRTQPSADLTPETPARTPPVETTTTRAAQPAPTETTAPASVPERAGTIDAQMKALRAGTRDAVLIPPNTPRPRNAQGLRSQQTPEGVFYFDPKRIDRATIRQKVADGTYGELLGHVAEKPELGEPTAVVTARTPEGTEVQSSAVPPERVPEQVRATEAQNPRAEVEVGGPELAERVIAERTAPEPVKPVEAQVVEPEVVHGSLARDFNKMSDTEIDQLRAAAVRKSVELGRALRDPNLNETQRNTVQQARNEVEAFIESFAERAKRTERMKGALARIVEGEPTPNSPAEFARRNPRLWESLMKDYEQDRAAEAKPVQGVGQKRLPAPTELAPKPVEGQVNAAEKAAVEAIHVSGGYWKEPASSLVELRARAKERRDIGDWATADRLDSQANRIEKRLKGAPTEAAPEAPPKSDLNVIRYDDRTKAISDAEGNIYATIKTTKKRNGQLTYEVKGYSKLAGKHSDLEGVYEARGEQEAIKAAQEIARRETAPSTPEAPKPTIREQAEARVRKQRGAVNITPETTEYKPATTPILKDVERATREGDAKRPSLRSYAKKGQSYIQRSLIAEFTPLRELESRLYGDQEVPIVNMARKFEQVAGAPAKAQADIIDFRRAVIDPIKKSADDFNSFLFLKRVEDRLSKDPERKRVSDWTPEKAREGLNELKAKVGEDKYRKFEEAGRAYQKEMHRALKLQVESGRMSQELYDVIVESSDFYAPFKVLRYVDDTEFASGTGRRVATTQELSKKIQGIDSEDFKLGNILQASAEQIVRSRILAEKNLKMLEIDKLADLDPKGELIKRITEEKQRPRHGYEFVRYLKNGEPQVLEVEHVVANAIQGMNPKQASLMSKAMMLARKPLQVGATSANATFQAVNLFFADLPRQALVSRYGVRNVKDVYQFPLDWTYSLFTSMKGNFGKPNQLYMDWLRSGAANSTIQREITPERFRAKLDIEKPGAKKLAKSILYSVADFSNAIEETSKIMGLRRGFRFENMKNLSGAERQAMLEKIVTEVRNYSGSPDFARRGSETRDLNLLFMFFNARLQGITSDVTRLAGRTGGKEAASAWAKLGVGIALPSTLLAVINNTGKYKEDYDKIPDWEKKNYWMIPRESYFRNEDTGEMIRDYWRIPKRELGQLIGNTVESAVDFAYKRDPKAAKEWSMDMVENMSPINIQGKTAGERVESAFGSINPALKIPAEELGNRDFFRHRSIVPEYMAKAAPEEQFRESTPKGYVTAGKALGVSPLRLQHIIEGSTGSAAGQFSVRGVQEGRSPLAGYPLARRFVRSGSTAQDETVTQEQQDFYTEQLQRRRARQDALKKFRAGEITKAELDRLEEEDVLTESDVKRVEKEAQMTPTQERFSLSPPNLALDRYERMDEIQRMAVKEIMEKKAWSLLNSEALTDTQKEQFQKRIDALGLTPRNPRTQTGSNPFQRRSRRVFTNPFQ